MKIAITSKEPTLDSEVEYRFGKSPYFIVTDPSTGEFEAFSNPALNSPIGAGPETAQFLLSKGVQILITGEVDPNAAQALETFRINVITGFSGKVKDAIEFMKSTTFPPPEAGPFSPAGPGPGFGRGPGMRRRWQWRKGRGGGKGRGRGAGRGKGPGRGKRF